MTFDMIDEDPDSLFYITHMGDTQCRYCESILHPRTIYHKCERNVSEEFPFHSPRRDHLLFDGDDSVYIVFGEKENKIIFKQVLELPF